MVIGIGHTIYVVFELSATSFAWLEIRQTPDSAMLRAAHRILSLQSAFFAWALGGRWV